ncbi:nuclear transport factor 2 family protein [Roseomonas sp. SSH11]|uniref:Nuclear transport factor 2 family protein n=1 Tax=Pararoseomonas baculiformis TaxID=2820812 RepID=A0ABS4AK44_9PROT|nr:ketosteroid isomerase-related protein [Pararoseomonas baculiformis]MBP0447404.1 nuclear transport factor 2 family protein [Pararoseomonas baculiformis]
MSQQDALALVRRYYDSFNRQDWPGMLDCLADDVAHDANQGGRSTGKDAFSRFLAHMERCYREELRGVVVMASEDGARAAAEFVVHGTYLATDAGLPEAKGQTYVLPAGAFLEVSGGRISRVTTCYNLQDWLRQVGA